MNKDKKTPKSTHEKTPSDYQAGKKTSSKIEIISIGKANTKKGK